MPRSNRSGVPQSCEMIFNHGVLLAAVVIGVAAGLTGRAAKPEQSMFGRALAVGVVGSALGVLGVLVQHGREFFAMAHLVYLIGTAAVPIAAALLLTRSPSSTRAVKSALGAAVLMLPIGLYASHIEPFWLRVERVELGVPQNEAGLRIGVLSDLQTTEVGDYENEAVDTLLAEEPDLILIPGDIWQLDVGDGYVDKAPEFSALLARIDAAVPHVFMVNGDTDTVANLQRLTQGTSIVVLDNDVIEVEVDGVPVRIGGLTHNGDNSRPPEVIEQLMGGGPDTFRILLAHRPGVVDLVPPNSPLDLIVAGHTHGGQIAIPFFGPPVTFTTVPRSVAAGGLHLLDGYPIYVSTGVGRERRLAPQVRFGVRPSVGIITTV